MNNKTNLVEKVFKIFTNGEIRIGSQCDYDGTKFASDTKRSWLKGLENELCEKTGVCSSDNYGFVFQEKGSQFITAIHFYKNRCIAVEWDNSAGEIPINIGIEYEDATSALLGL